MLKLRMIVLFCTLLALIACGSKMSDEVYEEIADELSTELAINMIETEDFQVNEEYEEYIYQTLEEIAKKHNHSVQDFVDKAEELDEGFDAIFDRVGNKVLQMLDDIEWETVEDADIELDHES